MSFGPKKGAQHGGLREAKAQRKDWSKMIAEYIISIAENNPNQV